MCKKRVKANEMAHAIRKTFLVDKAFNIYVS